MKHLKLTNIIFIWLFSVAFSVFIGMFIYFYESNIRNATLEQIQFQLSENSESLEELVTNSIARYKADLRFLHYTPPVSGLARSSANEGIDPFDQTTFAQWKHRLETIFSGFLENNLAIEQLRLIEITAEGKEIIRVQRRGGAIEVVPEHELQLKAGEPYYLPSTQLSPKQIYMSPLSLNKEYGEIAFPHKPTLRFSISVFDEKGRRYAFLIMNVDATRLIEQLSGSVFDYSHLVISGSEGYIIYHPVSEYRYTRDLSPEITWDSLYKQKQSFRSLKLMTKQFDDNQNVFVFTKKVKTRAEAKHGYINLHIMLPEQYFESLLNDKRLITYLTIMTLLLVMTALLVLYSRNAQRAQLLADTRREAAAIVDGSQDAIIGVNLESKITSLNNAAQVMLRLSRDMCIGKNVTDIKLISQLPVKKYVDKLSRSGLKVQEEQTIDTEDKKLHLSISVSAVLSEQGDLSGLALMIRDVSREKEAELKIKRLNSELESKVRQRTRSLTAAKEQAIKHSDFKSEFISNISHELRTPLNRVVGTINILKREKLESKSRRLVEIMEHSILNLSLLINDILDLSKIEAGKLDISSSPFDPVALIETVAESASIQAQEKGIELLIDAHELNCSEVNADPLRFTQILNNLLNNAIKYTEQGSVKLTAKGKVVDTSYRLSVTVEGSDLGISQVAQQKLFDAFHQAESEIAKEFGGIGLSLSICRKLCQLMGGDIEFRSTQGEGSQLSFYIAIPLESTELQEQQKPLQQSHCLLLLQLGDFKKHFANLLQTYGAKTQSIAIDEAEELNDKEPFDYIFIDINWYKAQPENSKIMLSSGSFLDAKLVLISDVICGELAELNPVYKRITKPVTQSDIISLVGKAPRDYEPSLLSLEESTRSEFTPQEINSIYGSRVLIVDDNEVNVEVASGLLSFLPIEIVSASNGKAAIEQLRASAESAKPFDCVLLDCQMPVMNGYQTIENIRAGDAGEQLRSIPVIAMTANAMTGEREKCLLSGMDEYLCKPLNAEQLRLKVIKLLLSGSKVSKSRDSLTEDNNNQLSKPNDDVSDELLWSAQDALERLMDNSSLMEKVLSLFVSSVPDKMKKLNEAVVSKDPEQVVQLAHSLKGLCGEICAYQLRTLFSEIESKASKGSLACTEELQQAQKLLPALIESIQRERKVTSSKS